MVDVIYIGIIVAFFAMATLFISACDRIVGRDEQALPVRTSEPDDDAKLAA